MSTVLHDVHACAHIGGYAGEKQGDDVALNTAQTVWHGVAHITTVVCGRLERESECTDK